MEESDIFVNSCIKSDGTFNCYLGEEITINDGTYNGIWQIVGVDTELGKGDIPLTRHHITLVPKTTITTNRIHSSNSDCHGYVNSDNMYAKIIPSVVTHLNSVLGEHLLTRRVKLTNATSSGTSPHTYMASGNGYYSVKANLMCQMQVYGTVNSSFGNSYDTGDDTEQLPGFATGKVSKGNSGDLWWLRDIHGCINGNSYYFSLAGNTSVSANNTVTYNYGVRPLITIG